MTWMRILLVILFLNVFHSLGQIQFRQHEIGLSGRTLVRPSLSASINLYADPALNAFMFCNALNNSASTIDPTYLSRCMVPMIHTLRLNVTKLFGSVIGWHGEGVMYNLMYGYEKSKFYSEQNPSDVCMIGAPKLTSIVPLLASKIVKKVICIVENSSFETKLQEISDPQVLTALQSFQKHIEFVNDIVFMDAKLNEQYRGICDIIHIESTYTLSKPVFQDLINFLLSTTTPFEAHRIIWMKDINVNPSLPVDFYDYQELFQPLLSSQWEHFSGFHEHIDSNGFHAKGYHYCGNCQSILRRMSIGYMPKLYQKPELRKESEDETAVNEIHVETQKEGSNVAVIPDPYLFHYHSNLHSFKQRDGQPPFYYHNMILISYTIRVFADTAYGLYEALQHAGYTQVYIVHDMTLFTLESIVIHHCKELFSEGFQRQYGETAMEDRWYCEGLLEGEEQEGDGRKQNQKQRRQRQRQRQRKVKRIPTESMLQIALGAHDVTMFLPHYIVYHMEQLWSNIAFGYYKEQYYTVLRNAVSIWTFSSLHRDYLELEGFAGKVHTLFLYSNHSIDIPSVGDFEKELPKVNLNSQESASNDSMVKLFFFGSCSPRRLKAIYYIDEMLGQYNTIMKSKFTGKSIEEGEGNVTISKRMEKYYNSQYTQYIGIAMVCGGWKELLFDYDLDAVLQGMDMVMNIHNEQLHIGENNDLNIVDIHATEMVLGSLKSNLSISQQEKEQNSSIHDVDSATVKEETRKNFVLNETTTTTKSTDPKFHGNVLEVHRINYLLQLDKFIISEQGNDEYLQHQYTEMVELVSSIDEMIEKIIYFANHGEERRARVMKQREIYERWNKNVTVLHEIMKDVWNKIEMIV